MKIHKINLVVEITVPDSIENPVVSAIDMAERFCQIQNSENLSLNGHNFRFSISEIPFMEVED